MLKFTVDGQRLELLGDPFVVADSFDFLTGSFKFYSGHDWDLTEKHVFFQLGEATPYEVVLTNDEFVKTDHVNLTTGTWDIHVVGYDIDGATLVERITTNVIQLSVERSGVPDGEPFPPSIIPDVLIVKDQTVPQTFVNGIPKLASTRVIDLDNEIVDKKHVADQDALKLSLDQTVPQTLTAPPLLAANRAIDADHQIVDKKFVVDTVATATADDFAHNSLSSLQGGGATERYHMTQAENASLHAHSNKTALDAVAGVNTGDQAASSFNHNDLANKQGGSDGEFYHMTQSQIAALHSHDNKTDLDSVSGVNTGDQDLSSYAKTVDLHSHSNKSDLDKVSGTNTGDQDLSSYAKSEDLHTHANKTDLDKVSGTNTGDQDLSSYAKSVDLHTHANKSALDFVSGTNTGDQTASSFNHNDLANKQGGTTNEYYHVTSAEKTVISNTSGTNTGDQVLPTRDSLGLDTDDNVTFANLSGTNTGDQDVSGAISAHNTDAGAHGGVFALHYTFRWDKVNALGVRLNNAQGISTTITNFCHRGTINAAMDNPFDSIYPWKDRNVCNISIDAYRALTSGASLSDCIISWLGDPDFDYAHANGAWVYTPEFWYKVWDDGGYRYFDISPIALTGYVYSPAMVEGRWHGGIYTLTVDGTSKSCLLPKPGTPGKNVEPSTLHTYAKNWGASVEDIYSYSATDVLMIVEFATMNMQTAIGNGVSDLYRQNGYTIEANATASATVKILTANASTHCIPGAIFDIGATDGSASVGSYVIASTAPDADPTYTIVTLTTDGSTPASVTVTTDHRWSVHGLINTEDASIGAASGYIGTNGKSHAYYRGQVAHANMFRYILGAYRQTATGNIWIANSSAEADGYDALNTGVHKDTGLTLPQGAAGAEIVDYIGSLHLCPDVPAAPFCGTVGGDSGNPVGDYCTVPTLATANTILLAGGNARYGPRCGRFYGYWNYSATPASWSSGAVPVLKTPV